MKKVVIILMLLGYGIFGQDYNFVRDDISDNWMIIGASTRAVYQDSNFAEWFNNEYTNYEIETKVIRNFKSNFKDKIIVIVLGTWCSDSRREVPRFLKILDFVEFPKDKTFFINVDRDKKSALGEEEGLNVEYVPTIIVYENGKELGRIIETPQISLEEDLRRIVN